MAFGPGGKVILVQEQQVARLWDCATHRPLGPDFEQSSPIRSMAFQPDGQTVLTGGDDGVARLWSAATGRLLDEIRLETPGWTWHVAFSRDGRTYLTATYDETIWADAREEGPRSRPGAVRLWDTATRLPVGAPFDRGGTMSAAFSADGTMLLTGGADGQVRFWHMPTPLEGKPGRIALWVQVNTGLELTAEGQARVLEADVWRARRRRLDELGGPPIR